MKLLQRYIISEIIKAFFLVLGFIVLFITISNFLDSISMLIHHSPPVSVFLSYFLLKIPFTTAQSVPFAMLLSILFVFSQFNRHNELTAMKSLGINFYSIMAPVLILSVIISIFSIMLNETVVSRTYDRAKYIKESIILKQKGASQQVKYDLAKLGSGGKVFYIRKFDGLLGIMQGICILRLDPEFRLLERLDAVSGKWIEDKWILSDGAFRSFNPSDRTETKVELFKKREMPMTDTPGDFIVKKRSAEDTLAINVFRLHKLIKVLKESGFSSGEEEINFHLKFAFPFASFILALLGVSIPFLFSTNRSFINAALGFVFTVISAFFYMGFVTIGLSFGKVSSIPPVFSAWMANIFFTIIGFIALYNVKK